MKHLKITHLSLLLVTTVPLGWGRSDNCNLSCGPNASCVLGEGEGSGPKCVCDEGYAGNGYICEVENRNEQTSRSSLLRGLRLRSNHTQDVEDTPTHSDLEHSDLEHSDMPCFIFQDVTDPLKCKCLDCEDDDVCGGLWKGKRYPGRKNLKHIDIHVVVSHCKHSLYWISQFTSGYHLASIHIITKCGESVMGAPENATIEILPNIGRCDHSYAYYITTVLSQKVETEKEENAVVVFLKDDISRNNFHQSGSRNDFGSLVGLASSENGFGCGIIPGYVDFNQERFFLSSYHDIEELFDFSMDVYDRNIKGYATDGVEFKSEHETLGSWYGSLGASVPPDIAPVCYGGAFAASVSNIKRRDMSTWKAVERSLSRGNNIQEGHYAERSWATLMATPLQRFQIEALLNKADGTYINKNSMHGALLTRPKLYLHVGVEGTSSSELLSESLVRNIASLRSDDYNVAVHGKWDEGIHGFPNIDQLGACMWSDIAKSAFPEHLKEVTICPENLLPELNTWMKQLVDTSQNLVLTNPWLVRPGTADSLEIFIHPAWDVQVVIYYRRYFEWVTIKFNTWRKELIDHMPSPDNIPFSSLSYTDYLRKYCQRLFYGKDIKDEYFPVQDLKGTSFRHGETGGLQDSRKAYLDHFDPTTNMNVEELTDLNDYTYFVALQYHSSPKFRHSVNIINYHDITGPESNFYCHVLHDAHNTCKNAVDREQVPSEPLEMERKEFAQRNSKVPFTLGHAVEEIVFAAYEAGRLSLDGLKSKNRFKQQVLLWHDMVLSAFSNKKKSVANLPTECLYQFEIDRLLQVSLVYEKLLLPGFFVGSKGKSNLIEEYSKWRFCSVDTTNVLKDPQWDFLFEDELQFTLSERPVVEYDVV